MPATAAASQATGLILVEDRGAARHLILNRPERRNALTPELMDELAAALREAGDDPKVHCVVLRGAGMAFSAGIDLDVLPYLRDPDALPAIRCRFIDAANLCEQIPKPTVAQVHGWCLGAGLELALACDLRVASENTIFAMPETRIGAVPDVGGCSRLAALVGLGKAKEMILTGMQVDAARALEFGLVNRITTASELGASCASLVGDLLECSPHANGLAKRILDAAAKPALTTTLELEMAAQLACAGDGRFRAGIEEAVERLTEAKEAR